MSIGIDLMKDSGSALTLTVATTLTGPVIDHRDLVPLFTLTVTDLMSGTITICRKTITIIIEIDPRTEIIHKTQGRIQTIIDSRTGSSVQPVMITILIGEETMIDIMPQPIKIMTGGIKTIMTRDQI